MANLSFSLKENNTNNSSVTIEDLLNDINDFKLHDDINDDIDMGDFYAQEINYDTNFTKKELEKIAAYYEIQKRRKRKSDLIEEIILYEKNPENIYIVSHRKKLWGYNKELKEDNYLRQFIIFD
jgi:hypothetical protein